MAITIPSAYIETFEANVRQLAQQKMSKLRMLVREVSNQSKSHNWDRLAASAARQKPNARAASPGGGSGSGLIDTTDGLEWTRRNTLIQTWDWGEIVATEEALQMLIDPYSSVTDNGVMAMKRAVDDVIITAATGAAGDGAGGTVAFPAGQVIGDGTTAMDLDMLVAVNELFATNDIEPDEERCLVIGPKQQTALLNDEKVTNFDYQNQKMLATGYVENFLGFSKVVVSNRLLVPQATELSCLAFTNKAIGLHVAGDIRAEAGKRPDMSFETQIYLAMEMHAVRVEDEHIVHIHALDPA